MLFYRTCAYSSFHNEANTFDLGLSEETKRTIIDLLDVEVLITIEGNIKYVDGTCHLILDKARLLVAEVQDISVTSTGSCSGRRWFAAP